MNTTISSPSANNIEKTHRTVLVMFFSLFSVLGSFGNILSLYCLWKSQRVVTNAVKLLVALNVGETVVCVFIVPFQGLAIYLRFKPAQIGYITINVVSAMASWYSSVMIFLITLNRYIITMYITKHHRILSPNRVNNIIILSSAFCVIAPVFMYNGSIIYAAIIDQLITITIMITMPIFYILLYKKMMKAHRKVGRQGAKKFPLKVLHNVLILISMFYIFRLPSFINSILYVAVGKNKLNFLLMGRIGTLCISCSACVNPIIYVLLDKSYQSIIKKCFTFRSKIDRRQPRLSNIKVIKITSKVSPSNTPYNPSSVSVYNYK